jgi:hypothetical protein
LWGAGRLARCVQIIGILIDEDFEISWIDSLWQMLAHCHKLYATIELDELEPTVEAEFLTNEQPSLEAIDASMLVLDGSESAIGHFVIDIETCIGREATKRLWSTYAHFEEKLNLAAQSAFEGGVPIEWDTTQMNDLLECAFVIANTPTLTLDGRRQAVLKLLGEWFNLHEFYSSKGSRPIVDPAAGDFNALLQDSPAYREYTRQLLNFDPG